MNRTVRRTLRSWLGAGVLALGLLCSPSATAQTPYSWNWSSRINSIYPEQVNKVAIDPADRSVYAIGTTTNTAAIATGPLSTTNIQQAFLLKYSRTGALLWKVSIGAAGTETGESVSIGPDGVVYIAGTFSGSCTFPHAGSNAGVATLTSAGASDVFFGAYSPDGTFKWCKQIGNINADKFPVISADNSGLSILMSYKGTLTYGGQSTTASTVTLGRGYS